MSLDREHCCRGSRLEGFQDILDGKCSIVEGLELLCRALKDLRCEDEYQAQLNVVKGIHMIKEGLRMIKKGLCELRQSMDRSDRRAIKEGVRDICRGLDLLCGVLKDICCGRDEEAEDNLVKAIQLIEKGLCEIEKALEDLCVC